jgi:hypothetical protein
MRARREQTRATDFMTIDPRLHRIVAAQLYPLLFGMMSGAHWLELDAVVGSEVRDETVDRSFMDTGLAC